MNPLNLFIRTTCFKYLTLFAVFLVLPASAIQAQDRGRGPGFSPPPMLRLAKDLDLSEEQRKELREIMEEQRVQMQEIQNQIEEAFGDQRDAVRLDTREKLKSVLTAEQLERFDELGERPSRPRQNKNKSETQI